MFNYFIEVSFCLMAFYAYYHFILRNETCHGFKRLYLVSTTVLSLIMPLLEFGLLPDPIVGSILLDDISFSEANHENSLGLLTMGNVALILYLSIAALLFLRMCNRLIQIRNVIVDGMQHRTDSCVFVQTKSELAPSTFFNYVFWKTALPPRRQEEKTIMTHEIAHVKGLHTLDMLFFELLKIVFWFNPIIHFYRKEASINLEFLADYQTAPEDHSSYNSLLAANAIESFGFSLENHFNKSFTLKRIEMLKRKKEKTNQLRLLATIPVVMALFILISCDSDLAGSEEANEILTRNQEVFEKVDEPPIPEGGIKGLYEFVATNLKYPTDARKKGIEGKVFVQFVVTSTGEVTDVTVTEGIGHGCDEASMEVIKAFTNWTPGVKDGENVSVRLTLPITFKIG